jgi:membrane protein DedA with SNARE-associated domain
MLERRRIPVIVGFRFLYDLRTVAPFVLGMSRVPIVEFVVLNIIGALAWATLIGGLGYAFGQGMELLLGDIRHYEKGMLIFVMAIGIAVWLVRWTINRRLRNDAARD